MTEIDPAQEWLRLKAVYAEKTDEELLALHYDFADLTDVAREVLTAEMRSRGLVPSPFETTSDTEASNNPAGLSGLPEREDLLLGGLTVAECNTTDEAEFLSFVLGEARIRSAVFVTRGSLDLTNPRVRVSPEDAARAAEVLARPIPDELRKLFAEASYDNASFATQRCPRCHSSDILLQPENPEYLNDWSCADCGHSWQDNLPAGGQPQNS